MSEVKIEAPVPTHTINHIFGLRRSGHHAVIGWLQGCYEDSGETTYHENSVFNRHLWHAKNWPDPSPGTILSRASGSDVLMVSYEDVDIGRSNESPVYATLQPPEYKQKIKSTVIVRDWFNMAASRLTYQATCMDIGKYDGLIFGLDWTDLEARWLDYANLVNKSSDYIGVNYNRWHTDIAYREKIAEQYELPDSDRRIDDVPDFASGSSFDSRTMHGRGKSMNVLQRWDDLRPDLLRRYKSLINNPVFGEINMRLFGIDQDLVLDRVNRRLKAV